MHATYPDIIIIKHVPAMLVTQIHDEPQPHKEREPQEGPEDSAYVFESVDPLAAAARLDEEPADDEAEDHETKDERLKREATSLEHLTLHDRKNPYCEFCQRGRMFKRFCKRVRPIDEEDEKGQLRLEISLRQTTCSHLKMLEGSQMSNRWW